MCGINMILDFAGNAQSEPIQQMMNATQHRGPDAEKHIENNFGNGRVFLASNRLQVIDRDGHSNQPFVSEDGRYALIFNGEVYNFEDLRNELLAIGVLFSSRSDTEVLLHWLIYKGKEGITKLNGMFAFIFVDFIKSEFLIARDPLGIKPLFVYQSDNKLILSSEIQGILASGLVSKQLNNKAIPHYLSYKYALRPSTFFTGIEEVMPGSIWQVDTSGTVIKSSIPDEDNSSSQDIKQLLIDAVVQQYSEPNNTGVMLSGGVDSTLLLAILNKELGYRNIPVFSVATKGKNKFATQDGAFAQKAAKLYQAEYNEIEITESSLDSMDEYITSLSQPIADSGGYLTWLISQKAEGKSKVLLSGAGADELFAGYNRHMAFYNYLKYRDKGWFNLLKKGKHLPINTPLFNQFKKLAGSINADPSTSFNNIIQSDEFRIEGKLWDANLTIEQHLKEALIHDQKNYLSADVLAITDHATMQHSIEARVPYLDNNLVNAVNNLSLQILFKNGSKWMLKEQLIQYGGKQFAARKKQGFGLPMNGWLKNASLWEFNTKENLIHSFIGVNQISSLVARHRYGKADLTQELWRILLLHRWLSHNFT